MAPLVTLLPCLFAKSSTAYNPFIYFIFKRNSRHKLRHFHRLVFSCSHQANSPDEGGSVFRTGTDKPCLSLTKAPGDQSRTEVMILD